VIALPQWNRIFTPKHYAVPRFWTRTDTFMNEWWAQALADTISSPERAARQPKVKA
jgi:hypothetical protein